jgi:hypothetical protein
LNLPFNLAGRPVQSGIFLLASNVGNRNDRQPISMNYNELIQLYFERAVAMQSYWNLYVIIVGGLLAFSSLRKQPAGITTALVSILFALFAYKNLDAMHDVTVQRFASLQAIKEFDGSGASVPNIRQQRDLLEPTLTPATYGSVQATHVTSDLLTIAALWAMEFRRRKFREQPAAA